MDRSTAPSSRRQHWWPGVVAFVVLAALISAACIAGARRTHSAQDDLDRVVAFVEAHRSFRFTDSSVVDGAASTTTGLLDRGGALAVGGGWAGHVFEERYIDGWVFRREERRRWTRAVAHSPESGVPWLGLLTHLTQLGGCPDESSVG